MNWSRAETTGGTIVSSRQVDKAGDGGDRAMASTYVKPESVLARTATKMVEAHGGGLGPHDGITECPACGEPLPCRTAQAAAEVLAAAGLAEASGLVAATRPAWTPSTTGLMPPATPTPPPWVAEETSYGETSAAASAPPPAGGSGLDVSGPAAAYHPSSGTATTGPSAEGPVPRPAVLGTPPGGGPFGAGPGDASPAPEAPG
ncbi:hypothetical protein AB0C31_45320, partial [Actinoplanes philippinensis]